MIFLLALVDIFYRWNPSDAHVRFPIEFRKQVKISAFDQIAHIKFDWKHIWKKKNSFVTIIYAEDISLDVMMYFCPHTSVIVSDRERLLAQKRMQTI